MCPQEAGPVWVGAAPRATGPATRPAITRSSGWIRGRLGGQVSGPGSAKRSAACQWSGSSRPASSYRGRDVTGSRPRPDRLAMTAATWASDGAGANAAAGVSVRIPAGAHLVRRRSPVLRGRFAVAGHTLSSSPMDVADLTRFLAESGAIGPLEVPAGAMARALADMVAHPSDPASTVPAVPRAFKRSEGAAGAMREDAIVRACTRRRTAGRASSRPGSLRDLHARPPAPG